MPLILGRSGTQYVAMVTKLLSSNCGVHLVESYCKQGVKLTFFPGSHLAPKHFKVVANSKKLVAIMTHTQKNTSHASINISSSNAMKNKPAKFALATKRTLECVIYNLKGYLNPRWRPVMIDFNTFEIVHVLRFRNGLNGELCCRFIFTNLQQSL